MVLFDLKLVRIGSCIAVGEFNGKLYLKIWLTVKVQDIDDPILTVKKCKTSMTLPLNCSFLGLNAVVKRTQSISEIDL